ncbi:MAG: outer membrane lipoprotein carrier protein LolA [Rhodospirillaceae bacterium]|nr:outer membrane lipoprotein carrier protein LolA [Rhodospirillaceae bacterium]MXW92883.1 outer membrane lipoprotein carrier protein LolA [Rhodospirillaceae bacterium]MYI47756.1 outer membrane lipoprotein carrier protein LolA [Rhodospirillaceae bacterium]
MKLLRALPALAALVLTAAAAAQTPAAARLTAEDRADLRRIEERVNGFRSLRTRFRQVSPGGEVFRGDIFIQRPGLMRIQFDRRDMVLLTSRLWLIVIQGERREPQYFPLNSTPAGILVRERIRFDRDIRVTGIRRTARRIFVTVVRVDAPRQGQMILIFERPTLDLAGWTVVDPQNRLTRVTLSETRLDPPLDPMLFSLPESHLPPAGNER